jgi:hypothetical protein
MVALSALWLPILLSAVIVFVVSSIIHMASPMHKGDCKKMPNEDKVLEAIRAHGVTPGEYMFPMPASMKDCSTPEMKAKFERGPVGSLLVRPPGGMGIGKSLLQWFVYTLVVSFFAAYIAAHALPAGAHYLKVFQIAGAAATAVYALSNVTNSIWKGVSWGITLKFLIDGIIYGLVTAGTFGWLWPKS